jgi:hypothetical protein
VLSQGPMVSPNGRGIRTDPQPRLCDHLTENIPFDRSLRTSPMMSTIFLTFFFPARGGGTPDPD